MTRTPGPWKIGEENVGGGFNIYAGPLRIAHTAIQSRAFTPDGRTIDDAEAKDNARLIVEAVNNRLAATNRAAGAAHFIERCRTYLDDPSYYGGHSDAAGATALELLEEAIEWLRYPTAGA